MLSAHSKIYGVSEKSIGSGGDGQARPLRVGIILDKPTQFEGPFFRYAGRREDTKLKVIYLSANDRPVVFDPELGRAVDWGIDLLSGYEYSRIPPTYWLRWLWSELVRERYDCLIINGYSRAPYAAALAIARLRGIRVALRIDSVLFNVSTMARRAYKRVANLVLLRLYDHFFATGSLAKEYLTHYGVEPRRISLFPYTVDTEYFAERARQVRPQRSRIQQRHGIPENARVVLAVAKLTTREAPWDLLRALVGLNRPDCWTIVVGDGDQRKALEGFVRGRHIENVVFTGYVPYTDLVSMYVCADVFVHAVNNEPWGVSVHEAIACGLPVVASSRVGAAYDLILPGRNGYVYQAGSEQDLGQKLLLALEQLDPIEIEAANREILSRWNYAVSWSGIVEGCRRCLRPVENASS